jgi:hypothetical protein
MQGDADGNGDSDGADFLAWQRKMGGGIVSVDAAATTAQSLAAPCY